MTTTLITNVSIFDGTGSDLFPGEVLVEGERIAAVAHGNDTLSVEGVRVIDGLGATLMPGLVECHAHVTYPNAIDRSWPTMYPPAAVETTLMTVHNVQVLLDHGFTSAYSAGAIKGGIEAKLRDQIDAGHIPGPRLRAASVEVYFPGDPEAKPMPQTVDEVRAFVRESAADGVDVLKLFISGLDGILPRSDWELVLSDEGVRAAAEEARAFGLALSCHVKPAQGIKQALRNGFRVFYHVEQLDEEVLDLMDERRDEIFCGPTISGIVLRAEAADGEAGRRSKAKLALYRENVTRMRERGVRVLPFGDYGFPGRPLGCNARDLDYFVRYMDFTPAEVLTAATKLGGELMGEKTGVIAPDYVADLLLVDGNPLADVRILEDATKLKLIMQSGNVHKLAPVS